MTGDRLFLAPRLRDGRDFPRHPRGAVSGQSGAVRKRDDVDDRDEPGPDGAAFPSTVDIGGHFPFRITKFVLTFILWSSQMRPVRNASLDRSTKLRERIWPQKFGVVENGFAAIATP